MRATALRIAKGSRRQGRCGRCGHACTWATLASRGTKNIPLVASPMILRVEHGANGVSVEVLGFDQIHHCPAPKTSAPRPAQNHMAVRHVPKRQPAEHAFASFTPTRLEQLRAAIGAPPADPDPQPELFHP